MSLENNIPGTTVDRFIKEMSLLYTVVIKDGWSLSMVPAPFIWGPPGVGKSEGVYQIAEEIGQNTGKKVIVTDIRLSMFSPIDLRGVPVADAQKEFAVWLKPKIFALDESEDTVNIIFFDELSSAPQQVQAAAYQITLDHRIGEHRLPDNCIIMGAGNRTIDKSVVFRMPNALANRLQHYEITVDFESWRTWAVQHNVHPYVLGYLSFDRGRLCQEEIPAEQIPFPSPRTWMFVSNMIRIMEKRKSVHDLYSQISACVGTDTAGAFLAWCKHHGQIPDVEDIFQGKRTMYPVTPDGLYALVTAMLRYIEDREASVSHKKMKIEELENMAVYVSRFPTDYQACLYHSLEQMDSVMNHLRKIKVYRDYKRRTNGSI
ncbi:MAG: AAA family ATPase [Lachnospiraceae bacterium]|nr:AAA family ATPase [Lachnospiraceae bacterium]